jgi:hypothetical protein
MQEIRKRCYTWLLTIGMPFSRIICSLSVSKFVRATVFILPSEFSEQKRASCKNSFRLKSRKSIEDACTSELCYLAQVLELS